MSEIQLAPTAAHRLAVELLEGLEATHHTAADVDEIEDVTPWKSQFVAVYDDLRFVVEVRDVN